MMLAIATLIQDDPYLRLTKGERIAARQERRKKLHQPSTEKQDIRHVVVIRPILKLKQLPPEPAIPEPEFSLGKWVERQGRINPLPKALWFSIESEMTPPEPRRPSIEQIQRAVCHHYGVRRTDMLSQRREAKIVLPRQVAVYICTRLTIRSLPEIGRRFGGRDHTTQIHSKRKIAAMMAADVAFAAEVEGIIASFGVSA